MALLTNEQEQLRGNLREFVDKEILPNAAAVDESKVFPRNIFHRLGELGYLNLSFAFQHPNTRYTGTEGAIIIEEISRGLPSLGLSVSPHVQCMNLIAIAGQQTLQERLLRRCMSGEHLLGYALSETNSGSNALNINTAAVFDGENWILSGEKSWITNLGAADGYVVAARSITSQRSRDISLFYIDADTPGLSDDDRKELVGLNNSPLGTLRMKNCVVPADCLIGRENEDYGLMKIGLDEGRYNMAAVALGLAEGALDERAYVGPYPPAGTGEHAYTVYVYALSRDPSGIRPSMDAPCDFRCLETRIEGCGILARGSLVGQFGHGDRT